MRTTLIIILVLSAGIFLAGCVQSSTNKAEIPAVPVPVVPAPEPATPVPGAAETSTPTQVVTILRYVSQLRDSKDPSLLFTLRVPFEWDVRTERLENSDSSDYRTGPGAESGFSVTTWYYSEEKDHAIREQLRQKSPAPTETMVKINGIGYDRFESSSGGTTTVSYIVRKNSANERGLVSVLAFTVDDRDRFGREDFETIIASFRYVPRDDISTTPGEEIPLYDLAGNALSRGGSGRSLSWGEWEGDSWTDGSSEGASGVGDSPGDSSTGGDSSGGSSSGGGHCGR